MGGYSTLGQFVVNEVAELPLPAREIANLSTQYPVICFNGPMGAGKTTLIKEVCKLLDVTDGVSSPTYSLVNEYATQSGKPVYHFDFYRINSLDEAVDMGATEYFDSGNVCLIEWPEKVDTLLPFSVLLVNIDIQDNNRIIILSTPTNENR
ncbi:MAG: tRNA (adenosine(37)-N6)-threonylcarbamoyltransferase complex ATPase subunit type 1 TsaE [Sphingobacteriales bacterium JAD_PAG50586_3]|nr:MAG: tRNA (adenosine(37)-N6)-threonylcarbamoyltransferase complex ATPase subunit type 1 TsaE [Sphingobacteriales bacterium JAD_PAG50586_3]